MTTALQPDVCDPVVSLGWITRQAESQVAQLCAVDQAKIVKTVLRPLPQSRCTLVGSLAKYRVYHFRASKTLRVSYRPTDQGLCIVHVGKHSEFDRFAQHFAGEPPVHLVPLQESSVMKNHQQVAKNNPAKSTSTPSNIPPAVPVAGDEELMLVESLRELIGKAVAPRHEALTSDWAARLDDLRKEIEQNSQKCGQRLDQHDARLTGLANEHRTKTAELGRHLESVGKGQQDLMAQIAQGRLDLDGRCEAQNRALEEVRGESARYAAQSNTARTELEGRLVALSGQLEEQLKTLATTVQEQQRTIVGLQAALAQVLSQMEELIAARKKPHSWRRFWNWARRFRWIPVWDVLCRVWRMKPTEPNGTGAARLLLRRCPSASIDDLDLAHVERGSEFCSARRS